MESEAQSNLFFQIVFGILGGMCAVIVGLTLFGKPNFSAQRNPASEIPVAPIEQIAPDAYIPFLY